jgi:hypothetical protein
MRFGDRICRWTTALIGTKQWAYIYLDGKAYMVDRVGVGESLCPAVPYQARTRNCASETNRKRLILWW